MPAIVLRMSRRQNITFGVMATALGGILLVCGLLNAFEPECHTTMGVLTNCSRFGIDLASDFDEAQEQLRIGFVAIGAVIALGGLGAVAWPWLVNSRAMEEYVANRDRRKRDD